MPDTGDYKAAVVGLFSVAVIVALALAVSNRYSSSEIFKASSLSESTPNRISVGTGKGVILPIAHTAYADGESFVDDFLNKYGFAGTDSVDFTPSGSPDQGWAYAKVYGSTDCESPLYAIGGIATNKCLYVNSTGILFSCTDDSVVVSKYGDGECSGSPEESISLVETDTCIPADEIFNASFSFSLTFSCSSTVNLPLGKGHYDVFRAFYNGSEATSTCEDPNLLTIFEASPTKQCIPVDDTDGGSDFSVMFNHDGSFPSIDLYEDTTTCNGTSAKDISLTTNCAEISIRDTEISYFWQYEKLT